MYLSIKNHASNANSLTQQHCAVCQIVKGLDSKEKQRDSHMCCLKYSAAQHSASKSPRATGLPMYVLCMYIHMQLHMLLSTLIQVQA
jgi:hypothetical protein